MVSTRQYRDPLTAKGRCVTPVEGSDSTPLAHRPSVGLNGASSEGPSLTQHLSFCYFLPLNLVFYFSMII